MQSQPLLAHQEVKENEFKQRFEDMAAKISPRALRFVQQILIMTSFEMENRLSEYKLDQSLLFPWKYEATGCTISPICSKRIHEAEIRTAYSCFNCRQCDNSILCYECFSKSNHDGHQYIQFQTTGGCCDCGDIDAWSQHGFCEKHGKKDEHLTVDQDLKKTFLAELKLAYFIYFWMVQQIKNGINIQKVKTFYGFLLFESSANLISEDYQLKYLLSQIILSNLSDFADFLENSELTIIQSIFRLDEIAELKYFNKICIELFPVERFRFAYIKEYFGLTFRNKMGLEHPIKELNYQYMARAKIIKELIEKGELQPLQLDQNKEIHNSNLLISLFQKYVDDFTYLLKQRTALDYFKLHFTKMNICNMFFYRKYTTIKEDEQQSVIALDEFMIKIYAEMLVIILKEKGVLKKIMKDLIEYIKTIKGATFSLVHQRVFAFTAMAYLQGNLDNLQIVQNRQAFQEIFSILGQEQSLNTFIQAEISSFLVRKAKSDEHPSENVYRDENSVNFVQTYPQKFLLSSLDILYVKILMKLYNGKIDFQKLYLKALNELFSHLCLAISSFAVSIVSMEIDELIVSNLLGLVDKKKYFTFLKRVYKSSSMMNAKEFMNTIRSMIKNQALIEAFMQQEANVSKGKITAVFTEKPLEKYIYLDFLERNNFDLSKANLSFYEEIPRSQFGKDIKIYSKVSIETYQMILQGLLYKVNQLDEEGVIAIGHLIELIIIHLSNTFAQTHEPNVFNLFKSISVKFSSLPAIQQAQVIFNLQGSQGSSQRLKEDQQGLKKKEILAKKRKQKEEIMKKKQLQLLKNFDDVQDLALMQACIYCKQNNSIDLYYVAFCDLANYYEKRFLKIEGEHLYFQTCGHKIHQKCYEKFLNVAGQINTCFLCKSQANMLVPLLKEKSTQDHLSVIKQFKDELYPNLLKIFMEESERIDKFYVGKHQENIVSILASSFVREISFRGLFTPALFLKNVFPIYSTLYDLLKQEKPEQLSKILDDLKGKSGKEKSHFSLIELSLIRQLEASWFEKDISAEQTEDKAVANHFRAIISLFESKSSVSQEIVSFEFAHSKQLINPLPEAMVDLLPLKPQCGLCKKLTNRLLLCLLCDWIGCDDDANCIQYHTIKQHSEGSAYVFLYNGQVIYAYKSIVSIRESIYQNAFGESASQEKTQFDKDKLTKFHLNSTEYQSVHNVVANRMIQNEAIK